MLPIVGDARLLRYFRPWLQSLALMSTSTPQTPGDALQPSPSWRPERPLHSRGAFVSPIDSPSRSLISSDEAYREILVYPTVAGSPDRSAEIMVPTAPFTRTYAFALLVNAQIFLVDTPSIILSEFRKPLCQNPSLPRLRVLLYLI